jgi:hypothetical protein
VAAALVTYFVNHISINPEGWTWEQEYLFPARNPVGSDFRTGLYQPAETLLHAGNPFVGSGVRSPFTVLVGVPFQLLDENHAYLIQMCLLIVMNMGALWMGLRATRIATLGAAVQADAFDQALVFPLFCGFCLWLVTSYAFLFSMERGSSDIYAGVAAAVGLWVMVKRPERTWLQVLCFSIAAHQNPYLAILLVLPVWKHGRRSLVPLAVVELALLMCLGPANAVRFARTITTTIQVPDLWQGNHSAASFGQMVDGFLRQRGLAGVPNWVFQAFPVALWLASVGLLLRRKYNPLSAVWFYCFSLPLLSLIPATSPDTNLVLVVAPLALMLLRAAWKYASSGGGLRLVQAGAVSGLIAALGLSYTRLPTVLGNKYPLLIAIQAVALWSFVTPPSGGRYWASLLEPQAVESQPPASEHQP